MSNILPEYFDPTAFHQPGLDYHFTIKRPYTTFSKSINLDFKEYNVSYSIYMYFIS